MPPWTATLVVAAVLLEAALCDDLTTSASRRKLTRFELGHEDNKKCWAREGEDGFYTVIDSHNHFRPFGGPPVPFEQYLSWMKKHGLLFSTVFGIGQLIKKSNQQDPDCCYYLHCPTYNYTVTPDPTNDRLNADDYTNIYMKSKSLQNDVVLTLSATYPNLQDPDGSKTGSQSIVSILDNLTDTYPGAFGWAGEINVFKHALAGNGFFNKKVSPRINEAHLASGKLDPFFKKMEEHDWPVTLHCDLGCDNYKAIPLGRDPANPLTGCEVPSNELQQAGARFQWWKDFLGPHYSGFFSDKNLPKRNFRKIQHLKVWNAILTRYPNVKIIWAHMGLSKELQDLHPTVHIYIMQKLFDNHPNLMTDMSWDVLPKMLLLNYQNRGIDRLKPENHKDIEFEKDAEAFLFNHTQVEETRTKLQEVFEGFREDVHTTGSANVIQGPTYAMALYLDMFNHYSERFLTGTDFVSSMGQPALYGGLKAYKDPPSGCMKDEMNHARQVTDTGSINIFLNNDAFRKIVLGENYFRLTGLDSIYAPPPVCGTDQEAYTPGLSTEALIGIVVAVILILIIIVAVIVGVFLLYKKKQEAPAAQ